jgi:hypothetical protein
MATVTDNHDVLQQGYEADRRWSWPAMLIAVLLALAVGVVVGWFASPSDVGGQATQGQAADQSDARIKQEGLSMINAYVAAWNAGSGEAVLSLMSDSGMVGVVRPAEFRGFTGWTSLKSDVARWQISRPAERRDLVKLVGQAQGLFGEKYEVADVWWFDLTYNANGGLDSGEAWVQIAGRYGTPVNPFFDQVIRFTFNSGDVLGGTPTESAYIRSVEHILRGPAADFPSY